MYRNTTDFFILIFLSYSCTEFMIRSNSNSFWWSVKDFYIYEIMPSTNRDTFTAFFQILILFIFFSCLIVLVSTFSAMLNSSGEIGYPCLVPDLQGKAFIFSPLSMMLTVSLSYMAFIMLRCNSSIHIFWDFYHK